MKICAIIAEYNPFHLGHLKHLEYVKRQLNAERIVVIMSGNFTQRGETAILNKFKRAKHAIKAGADMVIELPTVFATANAEIFAKGACKIINDLGFIDGLCFGVESGDKESYISLAKLLNDESKEFKKALKTALDSGVSLAKAKYQAVMEVSGKDYSKLVNSPNNVLGIEYTKALLSLKSNIEIYPMLRLGDHNDTTLKNKITSATSIRLAIKNGKKRKIKRNVPKFVYKDIKRYPQSANTLMLGALTTATEQDLKKIADCTEGLENRIKALLKDNKDLDALVEKISTKRYPQTRIRRIITSNLLRIEESLVKECLKEQLYAKVLAVNSNARHLISDLKKNSSIPVLTRKSDLENLKKTANKCFEKDVLASELYSLITSEKQNEFFMDLI
ncbi:MAG: nucleotidyltransferase family protein [Clostridia bacterium]|nr:nucleotidyltransferase family protein [Clostridia bacterium]